jgi:outer membrane protein
LFKCLRLALPLLMTSVITHAKDLPLVKTWELGLGVGAVSGPDYRGSKETSHYVAPIPYFIYRGKYIQSDRDGIRGQFLRSDAFEFSMSLSANITPDSDENNLRAELDLPRLGSTIEVGPAININLTGPSLREGWLLSLPLRGVFAIGGDDSGHIGYVLQPQLVYRNRWGNLSFTYRTSISYASDDYHSYYYDVKSVQATEAYPAFTARAGYSGWANQASISHQLKDWRIGLFIRHDHLAGAKFVDSPLVQTQNSVRGGIAIIRVLR